MFAVNWAYLTVPVTPLDEGSVLAYGSAVFDGALPYRDFVTFYGPAGPYVAGAAMHVIGARVTTERLVGFAYRALIAVAIYALPFPLTRRVRAGMGALVAAGLLEASGPVAYASYAAFAAMVGAVAMTSRRACPPPWRFAAGGFLMAVAVAYRLDFAAAAGAASIALLWGRPAVCVGRFAAGAALGLLPLAAVVLIAGPDDLYATLLDVRRSGPGRHLPLPLTGRLGVQCVSLIAGPVALLVGAAVLQRRSARASTRTVIAVALLLAGLIPYGLSRADAVHLGLPYATLAGLALGGVAHLWRPPTVRPPLSDLRPLILAVVGVAVLWPTKGVSAASTQLARALGLDDRSPAVVVRSGDRAIRVPVDDGRALTQILGGLRALRLDHPRLFVGPRDLRTSSYNDTMLYFLLPEATPSSRYWELNPGTANRRGSSLRRDLDRTDVLILDRTWDRFAPADLDGVVVDNGLNGVVARDFCVVVRASPYTLLKRCRRTAHQRPGAGVSPATAPR